MLLHMPLTETTPPLGSGSLTTTMWSPSYTVKKWCPKCLPCINPPQIKIQSNTIIQVFLGCKTKTNKKNDQPPQHPQETLRGHMPTL